MRLLLSAAVCFLMGATPATVETTETYKTEPVEVSASLTAVEKKVRDSSVKILAGNGHGSGGIIRYKDMQLILTAQHVADGRLGSTYLARTLHEDKLAVLVYADPLHDIAIL